MKGKLRRLHIRMVMFVFLLSKAVGGTQCRIDVQLFVNPLLNTVDNLKLEIFACLL